MEADGPDPAALLERVESVAPDRQFSGGAGYSLALSHRLEAYAGSASPSGPAAPGALTLTRGVARIADLMLELAAPTPLGIRTDVRLTRPPGDPLDLPDDVLAVLGREWAPLDSAADGWKTTLRLPGREPARSLGAERLLERGARHLARVLAESPRRFHEQFVFARWRVTLRRAVPVLVCVALIAAAASVPRLHLSESSGLRMLIFNSPPLLMMLFFCMREIPRDRASAAAAREHGRRVARATRRRHRSSEACLTMLGNPMNIPPISIAAAKSALDRAIRGSDPAPPCVDAVGHARRRKVVDRAPGRRAFRRAARGSAAHDDRAGRHSRRDLCRRRARQDRVVSARIPALAGPAGRDPVSR